MSGCWILKTEPSTYSYDDLERQQAAVWDGVRNPVAIRNLRAMKVGDALLIYHTGAEKAVVGKAEVAKAAYPDPKDASLVVVDIRATGRIARPVTLADIRKEKAFADLALVRQARLSVVPCSEQQYRRLLAMAE